MVYTERTDKHLTTVKDNAKTATLPAKASSTSSSAGAWSSQAADSDKWKYNNMVKDKRDQFNGMHFC